MHIISRINIPKSANVSSLYIRCNEGATINYDGGKEIVFRQGGSISSNSYFNSFYEKFYTKYTNIGSIYYLLKLQGCFQIYVYREVYENNNRELIFTETFEQCQLSDSVKIFLPNLLTNETAGRIYFELICLSGQGRFTEGLIATEQNKTREVSLAIISCTFKKEVYIKNTVNTILQDDYLEKKDFKLFVVDNGETLNKDDFQNPKIKLISNRNVGGSGGFTRGLLEALQSNIYSHFLLMDDDIELDSESIYRLFSLYEYANLDFAVAGSMLDLYKKNLVHEAGALYGRKPNMIDPNPFGGHSFKHDLDIQNATSLNSLLVEEDIDYGAFWFFGFSKEVLEKIGLPLPLFIKLDDVEFCLRIKASIGGKIVAFPSIAVWHEPFYAKATIWAIYYVYRNNLITHAIHGSLSYGHIIKYLSKELISSIFLFEYKSAELMVKAFEDYVKGPGFLKNNDPELLHTNILKLTKSYKTQNIQQNYMPPTELVNYQSKAGIFKKIASLLTLNGHLLPDFLTTADDVLIWQDSNYSGLSKAFAKKGVLVFREGTTFSSQNELNKLAGIKILIRWLKVAAKSSLKWPSISKEWKNASSELTSTTFWQQYLGSKK